MLEYLLRAPPRRRWALSEDGGRERGGGSAGELGAPHGRGAPPAPDTVPAGTPVVAGSLLALALLLLLLRSQSQSCAAGSACCACVCARLAHVT
jgi:hypothetical protein